MGSVKLSNVLISPLELETISKVVLIDTRPSHVFAAGHIAGAVNVHEIFTYLAMTTPEGIATMTNKFAKLFGEAGLSGAETAVIYEESMDTGFGQSCRGYVFLRYLGYPEFKIRVLNGGIAAWISDGKPVTTDLSLPTPKLFPVKNTGLAILTDIKEMAQIVKSSSQNHTQRLGSESTIILDTRDAEEWYGISSSPYSPDFSPRKGRIPGAVWIDWRLMMEETAGGVRFKNREAVLQECAKVGINTGSTVVVYCFKGARASNTLIALQEAGVRDVRLYMGSWNEWSRDASLPIDV